ncbi:MAG: hypothetical protein WEG36_15995 [Gemmatimonadota bacterium]
MLRFASAALFALFLAVPVAAQVPEGLMMRVDRSTNAADPDDVPEVTITTVGSGFQVNTGPAAVLWKADQTATGAYTLRGRFTLQAPSSHRNFYGLVFGGRDLGGAGQNYLYFMVAQTGEFILIHRANSETTHTVQAATAHPSIVVPDASGKSVNELEVRVGASEIAYVVNGTVVHTTPKSGMTGNTDGIWGVRINHVLPGVLVENLGVTTGN